jgi:serine/threonine protein kinase
MEKFKKGTKAGVPLVSNKVVLKNRWRTLYKLGEGAFGETYVAHDIVLGTQVAVKFESPTCSKPVLRVESHILRKLQGTLRNTTLLFLSYHLYLFALIRPDNLSYIVMQLQGQSLSAIRKQLTGQKLTIPTTALIGIHMINAIESVHERGFLHRDVKPANFVLSLYKDGYDGRRKCFIIDFGLSRQFMTENGEIRQPRTKVGFRGTARYASLHSHRCEELSRRDDIWSIFYILVEFATGKLPWSKEKEKSVIAIQKERYMNFGLIENLPSHFRLFLEHIQSLNYIDHPDYSYLRTILFNMFEHSGEPFDIPYDWERLDSRVRSSVSTISLMTPSHKTNPHAKICLSEDSNTTFFEDVLKTEESPIESRKLIAEPEDEGDIQKKNVSMPQPSQMIHEMDFSKNGLSSESSRTLTASIELKHFKIEELLSYGTDQGEEEPNYEEEEQDEGAKASYPVSNMHSKLSLLRSSSAEQYEKNDKKSKSHSSLLDSFPKAFSVDDILGSHSKMAYLPPITVHK